MSPLISIVIPVFNRADMIGETVESCLLQTHSEVEIVLVNDCSTDGLDEALVPFADDPRVRRVDHEQNKGVSAARNTGVEAARGMLIAFLDSDDRWQPTKLERQIALIEAQDGNHDGDRYLCGTLTEVRSGNGMVRVRPKRQKPRDVPLGDYLFVHKAQQQCPLVAHEGATLMGGCFAQTSSYLLSKELAKATPFRTSLNQYEDMAFLIDLDAKGVDFLLVEEPLTVQQDDDRPGRLGARDDISRGQRFLDEIGDALSDDAKLAFEATHLAHLYGRRQPGKVVRIVLQAFRKSLIAPRSVLGILSRSFLGQAGQKAIRNAVMGWRWRPKNRGAA